MFSPDVVLEGVGILFAPFLRDLLTYDLEAVKEALGIFTTTKSPQKVLNKGHKTNFGSHFHHRSSVP